MPNIKSAEKRVQVIRARTLRNKSLKSSLRTSIGRFEDSIEKSSKAEAGAKLQKALITIDKAVSKGILHKNTAARKKSRLTRRFNKIAEG